MNATQLLAHFDRLAEAPNAVPRLRRFILDLAVRGKLVEQDAGDEPATDLLKRIQAARMKLVEAGKFKEVKAPVSILGDLPANQLPENWSWVPFGATVNTHLGGGTPSKANSTYWNGEILWASVKDVGKTKYLDSTIDRITEAGLADSSSNLIEPGNLIVVTRMGLGKVSINRVPVAINQDLRALSLSSLMSIDYCYIYLKTHGFEGSGLTVKGIKIEELLGIAFPLPPLAEQHRIVAKVDELMALCDQLEAAQQERERRRDRLAAASLRRLNQPAADTSPETQREHARFHLHHLPRLTTRPEHIKAMRQTILALAVRGRLVTQNANEESAGKLLKRIDRERAALLKADYPNVPESKTQLRKQAVQVLPEGLSELPSGWAWATLMQCSLLVVDCHNKTAPYSTSGIPLIRTTNVRDGRFNLKEPKFVDEDTYARWSARCKPEPGDILITREAPMGEVAIIPAGMKICLGQRMMLARLVPHTIDPRFLLQSLSDPELMGRVQDKPIGATVQHLRVGGIETLLVPLPPLAEQHRIVAKVDELMALCDQLEAQLTTTQTDSRRLLEAVLEAALGPALI